MRIARCFPTASMALLLATTAAAQVPPGSLLVGNFAWQLSAPGTGGLFYVDPVSAAITPVTNLPCEVTGACMSPGTPWSGTDIVLRLPQTGELVASGPNWIGSMIKAYVLPTSGAMAGQARVYDLATYFNGNGLGCPAAARLSDDRVLLAIDPTSMGFPGPLGGALLGVLDPRLPPGHPQAVMPVPVSPIPPGVPNAVTVVHGVAIIAIPQNTTTDLYTIPVPQGGRPVLLASVPGGVNGLDAALRWENNVPYVSVFTSGYDWNGVDYEPRLYQVESCFLSRSGCGLSVTDHSGPLVSLLPTGSALNAIRLDPVGGRIYVGQFTLQGTPSQLVQVPWSAQGLGAPSVLTAGPSGGWGTIAAIDLEPTIEPYGSASSFVPEATWRLAPTAAPRLTNGSFTLRTFPADTCCPSVAFLWAFGSSRAFQPLPIGVNLLVSPDITLLTPTESLVITLPPNPTLLGQSYQIQHAQLRHNGTWSASSGLGITIVP